MRRGLAVLTVALVSLAFTATTARADPGSDDEEARAAMRRGVAAFARGDAANALAEYETAKRLVPHANAPYLYAAEALVALERYEEAVRNLERYLAKSPDVSDAEDVKSRIVRLKAEHYPAHLQIVATPADATVTLDGASQGAARALEVKPGKHLVELRAPAHETVSQEIDAVGDRDATLVFTLPEARRVEATPLPPVAPPPAPSPWRTAGWVTTAVGGTALLATVIVDVGALGPKISDYRAAADRGDPSARGLHDDVSGLRGLTIAGYVTGGVLTAAGLGLVVFGSRRTASPAVAVSPWVSPTSAGLGFRVTQ